MNSQNDDNQKLSPTGLMQIYDVRMLRIQDDVKKTRTKRLKTVIFNTLCSRCLHFQIFIGSCSSPGASSMESGDSIHSFLSQTVTILQ